MKVWFGCKKWKSKSSKKEQHEFKINIRVEAAPDVGPGLGSGVGGDVGESTYTITSIHDIHNDESRWYGIWISQYHFRIRCG